MDWEAWLDEEDNLETNKFIRQCTSTGRPCGDDAFVKRVELATQRDFTRKPPGPKPKSGSDAPMLPFDSTGD
jgi:REP-associated tyrosine transposase